MHANKISELVKIVPPPASPLDADESMLRRAEQVLQIRFPSDYLEFGRVYGSGTFKSPQSWEVWSPFRPTYPLIVLKFARAQNIYREATEHYDLPFGIFPEPGGILPFAKTPDGDWVYWRTSGEPDEWDVVDFGRYDKDGYEALDMGFSEYFFLVLTRQHVLERHENSDSWDPSKDLVFKQRVLADQGL